MFETELGCFAGSEESKASMRMWVSKNCLAVTQFVPPLIVLST